MISVVVMGDRSMYSFLGEIVPQIPIPKSKLGDMDIIVTPSYFNDVSVGNQAIELKSARLPIATNVIFPAYNANIQDYADKAIGVFYFEEPRKQKTTMRDLENIRKAGFPSITIVLYAPPRKFLESDISTYDEAIENSKTKYKKEGYTVIEYTPGTSILPLIVQLPSDVSSNCYRERLLDKIAEKRRIIYGEDSEFRWDYDLTIEEYRCDLSEQDKELITRYDSQEFALASLNVVYFERARQLIFENKRSSLLEPLLCVYKNFINNADFTEFIFWDLNKDIEILEESIRKQFYKSTFVNHDVIFQGSIIEYGMYENKISLYSDFFSRIKTFFKNILYEIIVHHIENRLDKLEELAKGG